MKRIDITINLWPSVESDGSLKWVLSDSEIGKSRISSSYTPMFEHELIAAIKDRMKAMLAAGLKDQESSMAYEPNRFPMSVLTHRFVKDHAPSEKKDPAPKRPRRIASRTKNTLARS